MGGPKGLDNEGGPDRAQSANKTDRVLNDMDATKVLGQASPTNCNGNFGRHGLDGSGATNYNNFHDLGEDKCNEKQKHMSSMNIRDKREVSPSSSVGSGGNRSKKKRKATEDKSFDGAEVGSVFKDGYKRGKNQ